MSYLFISDSIYVTFQEKTLSIEKVKIASSSLLDLIDAKWCGGDSDVGDNVM